MTTGKKSTAEAPLPDLHAFWPPYSIVHSTEKWAKTVAFDFDEVVASWLAQFATHVQTMYPHCKIDPERLLYYHLGFDPTVNLTPREFEHCFDSFVPLGKGGYGDLKPIGNILAQMRSIVEAGIKIKIVTHVPGALSLSATDMAPYHTGTARRVRMDMIRKMGVPIDADKDVEFVLPHEKRAWMARHYVPLLVEDSMATAASVAEWAFAVLLVPVSYNRGFRCPNVRRLDNRQELARTVIEFFEVLGKRGLLR